MDKIKAFIKKLMDQINIAKNNTPTPFGQAILKKAQSLLGTDASPSDLAPDELGCAETFSDVVGIVPPILSTTLLFNYLEKSPNWLEVNSPLPGDGIIAVTGQGGLNGITHGHVGIFGEGTIIMSNSSATGTFEQNYTLASWEARYKIKGGYPIYYFRKIA